MEVIDKAITSIKKMGDCKGSDLLGHALYSACHHGMVSGPSLLGVSVNLDDDNFEIFVALCQISKLDDYSNSDQSDAICWLHEYFGMDVIDQWDHAVGSRRTKERDFCKR